MRSLDARLDRLEAARPMAPVIVWRNQGETHDEAWERHMVLRTPDRTAATLAPIGGRLCHLPVLVDSRLWVANAPVKPESSQCNCE